ncbi:DUF2914 domain-containing protein [uncultured Fibrobacter sp.]|uniref:DUF2914 domain-containing protein n=1 Tax=uncultured Fibrobacter sp. TaxID=261512 RepID=UPI0025EACBC7|nr:DUF2914 domain-containing protein [uncultured Fibrobacter sp.]
MQFVDNLRQKPFVQKAEKFFPAIAFLGGFFWDSVTLGQMVENSDLIFLLAYYSGALILVILLSAHMEHPEGWTKDRIMAARAAAPRPQAKAPAPAVQAKAAPQVKPTPSPAPAPTSKARAAQSAIAARLNPFAKKVTKKVTDAASEKLKTASSQAKNVAQKIANDVGYESTAIPENAIVVEHRFLDREWSETWKNRFSWAVQFCFGSLFSALVVCYFKSSGSIASLILVILLAILLVGNEFLQKKYESFGVSLAFLCLLGTMFLNFTIPYLVHRIGLILFVFSTLLSLGICVFIQKVSRRSKKVLIAPIAISAALITAYVMNWVPPVPLVLKQQVACINFDKTDYSCDVDAPSFLQKLGLKSSSVHRDADMPLYYLSSVYAPADLKAEIEYRWYYKGPNDATYKLTDRVSSGRMRINGGREMGYRSYSKKTNAPAGKYRVETAFKDGAVIGALAFEVKEGARDSSGYVRTKLE